MIFLPPKRRHACLYVPRAAARGSKRRHACLYVPRAAARGLAFLLFLLVFLPAFALPGYLPVRNYSPSAYAAGPQNWAMAQDPLGRVYIANRDGLLRFDGVRWHREHLPNYTTVRCVFIDESNGRIYVGGTGEFGYFLQQGVNLEYHSLVSSLPESERAFSEIWNVIPDGRGNIWFQGDYRLFRYDGKKCVSIPSSEKILKSAIPRGDGSVYIATESGSLLHTDGLRLRTCAGTEALAGNRVAAILPHGNSSILIATAQNGLYLYGGAGLTPLPTAVDDFLIENRIFCGAVAGNTFVFGTVNGGAVTIDFSSGALSFINRNSGLQNNTVLGAGFDFNHNLWLCLDSGIASVYTDSPIANLLGSLHEIGTGYASLAAGSTLYLGTNQALFTLPLPILPSFSPPRPQKLLDGQVWSLDTIGHTLFISSDAGLYTINVAGAAAPARVEGVPGSWRVRPLRRHPGYALASTYHRFHLLKNENGVWRDLGEMTGYDEAGGRFEEDSKGNIWMGHWLKGVFRLKPDIAARKFVSSVLYNSHRGLPSDRNNSVSKLRGRLLIEADGGFFSPDEKGNLMRDRKLGAIFPFPFPVHLYALPGGRTLAVNERVAWEMQRDAKGRPVIDSTSFRPIARQIVPGFESFSVFNSGLIVSLQSGFYCIDPERRISDLWHPKAFVAGVYAQDDSLIYAVSSGKSATRILKIPYSLNSLRFEFAMPEFRDEKGILFSCILDNYDKDWSPPSFTASKEYTQLHEGSYTLRLRGINPVTGEMSESALEFRILPPWYRSTVAYIIYALITLATLFFLYRLLRRASLDAARKVEARNEEEMRKLKEETERETLQKDYEIAALKSEQLEQDIKHKSSELSNITMNVIRKNETLLNISSRLERIQHQVKPDDSLHRELEKLRALISHNISHDDDWRNFNQNFDIVYENYTRRLTELHPDLSQNERRICCYLKMGLSSKEIAPLFNVAPRSVEMSRYRLRKKLNLSRDINLTEYLQQL